MCYLSWRFQDILKWLFVYEYILGHITLLMVGFPGGSEVKASASNAGDLGSIPGSRRSSGEGNGNPLQYSCLENPMGGGAWWATVHGVSKSLTWLSDLTFLQGILPSQKCASPVSPALAKQTLHHWAAWEAQFICIFFFLGSPYKGCHTIFRIFRIPFMKNFVFWPEGCWIWGGKAFSKHLGLDVYLNPWTSA